MVDGISPGEACVGALGDRRQDRRQDRRGRRKKRSEGPGESIGATGCNPHPAPARQFRVITGIGPCRLRWSIGHRSGPSIGGGSGRIRRCHAASDEAAGRAPADGGRHRWPSRRRRWITRGHRRALCEFPVYPNRLSITMRHRWPRRSSRISDGQGGRQGSWQGEKVRVGRCPSTAPATAISPWDRPLRGPRPRKVVAHPVQSSGTACGWCA